MSVCLHTHTNTHVHIYSTTATTIDALSLYIDIYLHMCVYNVCLSPHTHIYTYILY